MRVLGRVKESIHVKFLGQPSIKLAGMAGTPRAG